VIQVGSIIGGRLRVDRFLGAGGMGVVVAATHLELDQRVAVKVLHDELAANPTIVARFLREARAVANLRTDHVCRVFDVGRLDNGAPYIVMELLEGSDLGAAVARGPVSPPFAVDYVIQACIALAEAHAAGVVHRDLKPANLFVTRRADGSPMLKVLDFGIAKAATAAEAKLTHTASTMGSPGYMSPEQIKSARDVDLRTDIWALGVTLFQLLAGRMPFAGTQLTEIAVNITTAQPAPLDVEAGLRAIVLRCLEKEPERRYPDVAALATALLPFGGPSAARFVQDVTGARPISAPITAPSPVVAAGAPTAASLIVDDPRSRNAASVVVDNARSQVADPRPPRRSRRWLVVAGLVVALLAGALVAWQLGSSNRSGSPVVAATPTSDAAQLDPAPAAVAAAVPVDAFDPWQARPDDPEAVAGPEEPPEAPAIPIDAGVELPEASGAKPKGGDPRLVAYRAQMLQGLRTMESMFPSFANNPATLQNTARGAVAAACSIGEPAMAQRWLDRLTDAKQRAAAVRDCASLHVPIVDHGDPKPATKP
jgi:hypothetical protein